MEWTLCCWILVKDASQVCDSVINLVELQTEKPIQQNQRLLTENVHLERVFFCCFTEIIWKSIQKDVHTANIRITGIETEYHKIELFLHQIRIFFYPKISKLNIMFCIPDQTNITNHVFLSSWIKSFFSPPWVTDCSPRRPLGTWSDGLPSACKDANMNSEHSLI